MESISKPNFTPKRKIPSFLIFLGIFFSIGGFILLSLFWRNIRPGYVGIVFDKINHSVTARQLEPGWAFINPVTQVLREYPVTIITYGMLQKSKEGRVFGDDSIKVQSNEGQQLNLDTVIQFQVIKTEAAELYTDWGGAPIEFVEESIVRQYTRSKLPIIASQYSWEEITSEKRSQLVEEVTKVLREEFKKRHLNLISFGIREVHLPDSLQNALNQKITAQQLSEQQRYQLKQAEIKAKQDETEAIGKANATKAMAEGDAQAILVKAQAQAEANEKLSKTLTTELIKYQQVQRWDGKLPLMSSETPAIIDFKSLRKE